MSGLKIGGKMRIFTAILFTAAALIPWAHPVQAESSAGYKLKAVDVRLTGNEQSEVREYDGRNGDYIEGKLWLKGDYGPVGLKLEAKDLAVDLEKDQAGDKLVDENVSGDLTLGSHVRVRGGLKSLTHRSGVRTGGGIVDNRYVSDIEANGDNTQAGWNGEDLGFERLESKADLMFRCSEAPVRVNFKYWQELELGDVAYIDQEPTYKLPMRRRTRDLTAQVEGDFGGGTLAYEGTTRKFAEKALSVEVGAGRTNFLGSIPNTKAYRVGEQAMRKHKLTYAHRFSKNLHVAFGAANRWRKSFLTQYSFDVNTAHVAVSYKPTKNLALSGRFYGRVTQVNEDQWIRSLAGGGDHIDFYQYTADLKARYTGFKRVVLKAQYKPVHTHRRDGEGLGETYGDQIFYQDGTYFFPNELKMNMNGSDIKHQFNLEAEFELPHHSELAFGARGLLANRGAYAASPEKEAEGSATLTIPMSDSVHFMGKGSYMESKADSVWWQTYQRNLARVLLGMTWMDKQGRGSMGMNYGYEDGESKILALFGAGRTVGALDSRPMIRIPNAKYEYKNHTVAWNGMVKLPKDYTVRANLGYTLSEADFMVVGQFDPWFTAVGTSGSTIQNVNPTNLQIVNFGVAASQELGAVTATLGYGRRQHIDGYYRGNNAKVDRYSLTLAGKF